MLPILSILNPDFLSDLSDLIEEHFSDTETETENEETPTSYYHFVSDKYENGKKVSHKEKEVRDGKVIKDVEQTAAIEGKKEEEEEEEIANDPIAEIDSLKKEIETLKELNESLCNENKTLANEKEKLTNENKRLYDKLDKIRQVF